MESTVVAQSKLPSQKRGGAYWLALAPWLWIAPALLFVIIFLLYPVINTIWLSFFNFDSSQFVGLSNYGRIFTDPSTHHSRKGKAVCGISRAREA